MNFIINIKSNSKANERKKFGFNSINECCKFLIKLFIKQGGRCFYTNAPMTIETSTKNPFKMSPERLDPRKSYSKDNIVLILVALNAAPRGQWLNKDLSEDERTQALNASIFNQEYWDSCTKMTPEIKERCLEAKEHGRKFLLENVNLDLD